MSPAPVSDAAILAAIPEAGVSFPALAEALGLTQRRAHPLVERLVRRGALVSELRDGVRWLTRDGHSLEVLLRENAELRAELATLRRAASRARTTLTKALGAQR